jgi:hypothetical protein
LIGLKGCARGENAGLSFPHQPLSFSWASFFFLLVATRRGPVNPRQIFFSASSTSIEVQASCLSFYHLPSVRQ